MTAFNPGQSPPPVSKPTRMFLLLHCKNESGWLFLLRKSAIILCTIIIGTSAGLQMRELREFTGAEFVPEVLNKTMFRCSTTLSALFFGVCFATAIGLAQAKPEPSPAPKSVTV